MSEQAPSPHRRVPGGVTVVIAAYDPLPELDEQLSALTDQTYRGPIEVIVSDNGGSAALRDHLAGNWATDRLTVRWVDSSQRRGTAYARTVGARAGTHEFIAYTDQDDRVHPGWLAAMTETAAQYDLVGGKLDQQTLNAPDVARWRDVSSVDALPVCARFLPFASGCNFGIWREVFEDIDGWDADFVPGEDIDICWRAQLRGHTLGYNPDAVVAYRFRSTIADTYRQAVFYQDGEARLAQHYRAQGARRRPLLHAAVHVIWLLLRCPLFPGNWSRAHRGKWAFHAGMLVGRVRGSLKYRVFYL
ncbi:glycosyltransferase [Rhodococcus sp. D2-41]|uniref:glycosyltransferase n=1 Tax=Speluncibacter jeojiensis TaxID=2710754 RepID=UPI00240E9DF7|nr:glycosyltransferase [Rhodococcus sp. D2-41]MDG3009096.1 glycosyltransferase [Rhodococcus sp. D2-41]